MYPGIGEVEWLYKTTFQAKPPGADEHLLLEFEGLDTICDVFLVGSPTRPQGKFFYSPLSRIAPTSWSVPTCSEAIHTKYHLQKAT